MIGTVIDIPDDVSDGGGGDNILVIGVVAVSMTIVVTMFVYMDHRYDEARGHALRGNRCIQVFFVQQSYSILPNIFQ